MIERFAILIVFGMFLFAAVPVCRWWLRRKTSVIRRQPIPEAVRGLNLPARPAILYFTTADCVQCRLQQTPILERLGAVWGDRVHIRKLDAVAYEPLAQHFGILTVPTTVILDAHQQVEAINHGVAHAQRLQDELAPLLSPPPPPTPPALSPYTA